MENNKYLIALDLDGTLLNDDKEVTPMTQSYLNYIADQGHIIVLASGRLVKGVLPTYRKFHFDTPIICNNGMMIYLPEEDRYLQKNMISKEAIISFLHDVGLENLENIVVEMDDKVLLWKHNDMFEKFFSKYEAKLVIGDIESNLDNDGTSLIFCLKDISRQEEFRAMAQKHDKINIRYWADMPEVGEFTLEGSDKGIALDKVREYYGIKKENVIAFGDSGNDLYMLQHVAHPYLMKNAAPYMHEKISNVTEKDNNSDGIYYALTEFTKENNI